MVSPKMSLGRIESDTGAAMGHRNLSLSLSKIIQRVDYQCPFLAWLVFFAAFVIPPAKIYARDTRLSPTYAAAPWWRLLAADNTYIDICTYGSMARA